MNLQNLDEDLRNFLRTITPIMQSYVVAYHFHFHERLIRAIKDNLLIYGIAGGLGLILIIWVLIELSIHGIHFGS